VKFYLTIILGNITDTGNSDKDYYAHLLPQRTHEVTENMNVKINVQQLLNNFSYETDLKELSLQGAACN